MNFISKFRAKQAIPRPFWKMLFIIIRITSFPKPSQGLTKIQKLIIHKISLRTILHRKMAILHSLWIAHLLWIIPISVKFQIFNVNILPRHLIKKQRLTISFFIGYIECIIHLHIQISKINPVSPFCVWVYSLVCLIILKTNHLKQ